MTEKPASYETRQKVSKEEVDDALAMLGVGYEQPSVIIEPPKVIRERRGRKFEDVEHPAWVKFSTAFKDELRELKPSALKVFVFIALSVERGTNTASPGTRAIAEGTGLDKDTVTRALADLEAAGLLHSTKAIGTRTQYAPILVSANEEPPSVRKKGTPELSEQTAELSPKSVELSPFSAELSERGRVNLHNQINQNDQTHQSGGGLSETEHAQANAKVDAIIANGRHVSYQNRDKIPEVYLPYADLYASLTGQEPTKRVINDWLMTFAEWKTEALEPDHVRAAYQHAMRPEGGFLVARPGSLTNTAVAMKSRSLSKSSAPGIDHASVEATRKMIEQKETPHYVPPPAEVRQRIKGVAAKLSADTKEGNNG